MGLPDAEMRTRRGHKISMIFHCPIATLNSMFSILNQTRIGMFKKAYNIAADCEPAIHLKVQSQTKLAYEDANFPKIEGAAIIRLGLNDFIHSTAASHICQSQ